MVATADLLEADFPGSVATTQRLADYFFRERHVQRPPPLRLAADLKRH